MAEEEEADTYDAADIEQEEEDDDEATSLRLLSEFSRDFPELAIIDWSEIDDAPAATTTTTTAAARANSRASDRANHCTWVDVGSADHCSMQVLRLRCKAVTGQWQHRMELHHSQPNMCCYLQNQ